MKLSHKIWENFKGKIVMPASGVFGWKFRHASGARTIISRLARSRQLEKCWKKYQETLPGSVFTYIEFIDSTWSKLYYVCT